MSTTGQKPRQRAFARKVRTGCLTCKKRRKRCDEERPTCRRCRDGDYKCDGYLDPATKHTPDVANAVNSQTLRLMHSPALNWCKLPGDASQHFFSNHFFTHTVRDLTDLPETKIFWTDTVVALQQQSSFIQPAIAALGAAHWLFLTRVEQEPQFQAAVYGYYNLAISLLTPSLTLGKSEDLPSIMTCCLLFVCLEGLRGNQAAALRHLEAGSRLFLGRLAGPAHSESILKRLAAMFHSLTHQSALFSRTQLLPDPAPHLSRIVDLEEDQPRAPFSSIDEATYALERLDGLFNQVSWTEKDQCAVYVDGECDCSDDCNCFGCQEWSVLSHQVANFNTRLKPLAETFDLGLSARQRQRILRLQLLDKIWQWTMEYESQGEDIQLDAAAAGDLLDLVERILELSASRPTFSLSADVVPSVITIYESCTSVECRQRAIGLLQRYPRREVIYNSDQVADILESHFSRLHLGDGLADSPVIESSLWSWTLAGS